MISFLDYSDEEIRYEIRITCNRRKEILSFLKNNKYNLIIGYFH
jgi:hypothetical protein